MVHFILIDEPVFKQSPQLRVAGNPFDHISWEGAAHLFHHGQVLDVVVGREE